MEFNIREGTPDDWKEIDRVNRAVLPENYDENVYQQLLASPTTICFVAVKAPPEAAETVETIETPEAEPVVDNADDVIDDNFEDELDEGFEENQATREIAGYIIVVLQFDNLKRLSSHVYSIGISEEFRRKGLGSRLLSAVEGVIATKFPVVRSITLHVRKSNKSAYKFYCKTGFARAKVVKKYYPDEDAYLMKKMMT